MSLFVVVYDIKTCVEGQNTELSTAEGNVSIYLNDQTLV